MNLWKFEFYKFWKVDKLIICQFEILKICVFVWKFENLKNMFLKNKKEYNFENLENWKFEILTKNKWKFEGETTND